MLQNKLWHVEKNGKLTLDWKKLKIFKSKMCNNGVKVCVWAELIFLLSPFSYDFFFILLQHFSSILLTLCRHSPEFFLRNFVPDILPFFPILFCYVILYVRFSRIMMCCFMFSCLFYLCVLNFKLFSGDTVDLLEVKVQPGKRIHKPPSEIRYIENKDCCT